MKLMEGAGPDGTVAQIGQIVIDWVCWTAFSIHTSRGDTVAAEESKNSITISSVIYKKVNV